MINLREVYYDKCPERLQFILKKKNDFNPN